MARDNKLFQEALKRGSAHAWNEEWNNAAEQYRLALQEFPDDVSALTYLAMALYRCGEYRQSLALYQSLWNSQPSNLTMLQRVAELQEAVGEREAAAISYGHLAEAHTRRRSPRDAFKAWQKVVEFTPGNPLLWSSLIEMAVQVGAVKEVIPGYLGLARDLALQSRFQEAIQIVERAVSLDATNPHAMGLLNGIRRAMEYWWRATGLGELVLAEDLARLIPPVEAQAPVSEQPARTPELPIEMPPRQDEMPAQHPGKEDRPAITVYASNVTLSMDRTGSISIQGDAGSTSPSENAEGGLTWEEFETLASPHPTDEIAAPPVHDEPGTSEAVEAEVTSEAGEAEVTSEAGEAEVTSSEEEVRPDEALGEEPSVEEVELAKVAMPDGGVVQEESEPDVAPSELPEILERMDWTEGWDDSPDSIAAGEPLDVELEEMDFPQWLEELEAPAVEQETPPTAEEGEPAAVTADEEQPPVAVVVEVEEEEAPAAQESEALEIVEEAEAPTWLELMQEAEVAASAGELERAVQLYEQSLTAGIGGTQQFTELGDVHERLGQLDQASHAYAQALELSANSPQALLGLARVDLRNHKLDAAEQEARRALDGTSERVALAAAVELLLDILRERSAYADIGGAAEGLAWLHSSQVADRFPPSVAERIAQVSRDLLCQSVAEHLDELVELPKPARNDAAAALSKAERLIEERRLRTAADEMYRLVSLYPDFLPAQSVLGRVLVAQGRGDEAIVRARRLLELYALRERQTDGLEVLLWLVRSGTGTQEDLERLNRLLKAQNRTEEPERSSPGHLDLDGLLLEAESMFASGDIAGAAGLIESALQDVATGDQTTTAALLRILQLLDPSADGRHDTLVNLLEGLGLPEDLASR